MTKPLAGKTITLPVFVRAYTPRGYSIYTAVDGFDLCVSPVNFATEDSFILAEATTTFTIPPDFDPVAPMVASIQAEKEKLTAEFTKEVAKLNRRLSELQAIEFTPAAEENGQ